MKRSDFLAIIPSLSALPLMGASLTKTDSGIFIEKPQPIVTVPEMPVGLNPFNFKVSVYSSSYHIADGIVRKFEAHKDHKEYVVMNLDVYFDGKSLLHANKQPI